MRRSESGKPDDSLYDLPIDSDAAAGHESAGSEVQEELPLEEAPARPPDSPQIGAATGTGSHPPPSDPERELYGRRWAAGTLDLAAHLVVLAAAVAGSWALGAAPARAALPPLALFTAAFSFVYHVMPLTFWGRTPGMAGTGLIARAADGGPLTINQAVKRWLGAVFNVASLGFPFLVSRNRSLADLFSRSQVARK